MRVRESDCERVRESDCEKCICQKDGERDDRNERWRKIKKA